ncbi:MAG: UDP-N-acetylglucosamine 4,6-dehydratase family protein, partial [Pseudomonadota bacterium]
SEICRQIAKLAPQALILIDANEYALYSIYEEITKRQREGKAYLTECIPLLANTRDEARMAEIFSAWGPHTVYHAAAYKHVPLVEHNLLEGVANNVLGTLTIARVARAIGVENCVLISTDKAVRPTNIMGATKRLSELIFQACAATDAGAGARTTFSMVRFGNVLGSSGSVIPRFREQIASGGPVTVTHPEITRFFMTIPEAAQLVIQAGGMADGGDVFVLDMGEPVKIVDLARAMIELSGRTVAEQGAPVDKDSVAIEFMGLRPGEKLYEELLLGDDTEKSSHPRIFRAREPFWSWSELKPQLDRLETLLAVRDHEGVRDILRELVTGFVHEDALVDWVAVKSAHEQTPLPDDPRPDEVQTQSTAPGRLSA